MYDKAIFCCSSGSIHYLLYSRAKCHGDRYPRSRSLWNQNWIWASSYDSVDPSKENYPTEKIFCFSSENRWMETHFRTKKKIFRYQNRFGKDGSSFFCGIDFSKVFLLSDGKRNNLVAPPFFFLGNIGVCVTGALLPVGFSKYEERKNACVFREKKHTIKSTHDHWHQRGDRLWRGGTGERKSCDFGVWFCPGRSVNHYKVQLHKKSSSKIAELVNSTFWEIVLHQKVLLLFK